MRCVALVKDWLVGWCVYWGVNLSVVEIIGKGGHSSCLLTFFENDSMKLGKNDLCQINHSVLC